MAKVGKHKIFGFKIEVSSCMSVVSVRCGWWIIVAWAGMILVIFFEYQIISITTLFHFIITFFFIKNAYIRVEPKGKDVM